MLWINARFTAFIMLIFTDPVERRKTRFKTVYIDPLQVYTDAPKRENSPVYGVLTCTRFTRATLSIFQRFP
jgi:hypothetical protein